MDNFKLIYRILRFLEAAAKHAEFDDDSFTSEHYNVNENRWASTLEMLVDRNYIKGVVVKRLKEVWEETGGCSQGCSSLPTRL